MRPDPDSLCDAFTLLDKFEGYLDNYRGNLLKAAVETVKEWRTDRALRNLEAMLIVADAEQPHDPGRHRAAREPVRGVQAHRLARADSRRRAALRLSGDRSRAVGQVEPLRPPARRLGLCHSPVGEGPDGL